MENQAPKRTPQREFLLKSATEGSTSPGVYLMQDETGGILYVGKAKNLRNRLRSYFQPAQQESARLEMLVERIHRFEVILTETEAEALVLEATLIKKHKPRFNVRLKDDKAYPYIRIQVGDDFPKLDWTRRVRKDGARYYGPFPSAWSARQVVQLLNATFKLRDCSENTFRHRSRPCLLYQMEKCTAPCVGKISLEEYRQCIDQVVEILGGKADALLATLKRGMEDASEREEFEKAAEYRDQIRNLELVVQTQGVQVEGRAGVTQNQDVIGLARSDLAAHGVVLEMRGGKLLAVRHYHLHNVDPVLSDSEVIDQFLKQHYLLGKETPEGQTVSKAGVALVPELPVPSQEAQEGEVEDEIRTFENLVGIQIRVPDREPSVRDGACSTTQSREEQQLVNVANANARHALELEQKRNSGHGIQSLEEIQAKLHLDRLPHRIECYDISNIQGQDAVASRVVFIDGAPEKNLYRRYKMRTVVGSNDFAMMKEVLERRFLKQNEAHPDLVVVDGGKGQLAQASTILEELNIQGVAAVGLAKARVQRNFQAKEVQSSLERIFIPNRKNPIPLYPHSKAYRLLTHIRDEAHRFAVSYHRKVRSKRITNR